MKYFINIILFCLFFANQVFAYASISVDVDNNIPLNKEFEISFNLDTDENINTISTHIQIPNNIEIDRIDDSGSVVNLFIDKPIYNKSSNTVDFSGIIPGGFVGKGNIIKLVAVSSVEGHYSILKSAFDIYSNNGTVSKKIINSEVSNFTVSKDFIFKTILIKDVDMPERFTISVAHDPVLYNNKWLAFFSTQDKGSGVARYQIAEKPGDREKNYNNLKWKNADSPFVLNDQDLKSFVYVKAIDQSGNERIEYLEPTYPITPYDKIVYEILPLILILLTAYITWRLWSNQFKIKE